MSTLLIAIPLPAGGAKKFEGFVEEIKARIKDHARSRASLGVTLEACAIQTMPQGGDLFLLCLGGDDPVRANRIFADSQDAYDRWFKDKASPILGASLDQPLPAISRTVFDWHA